MNEIGTMESGLFYNNMISDCENCFAMEQSMWWHLLGKLLFDPDIMIYYVRSDKIF